MQRITHTAARLVCFGMLAGVLAASGTAQADTHTWDSGGGDDNFNTGANWDQGDTAPVDTDSLAFGTGARTTPNNNLAGGTDFAGITFNTGSPAFTIGGNAFDLTGNIVNNDDSLQTLNTPIVLSGATRTVNAASGNITLGGVISGSQALTKSGNNTLTLSGANSYTGKTTVDGGIVIASHNTAFGTANSASGSGVTVNNSGQVQLTGGITVGDEALDDNTSYPAVFFRSISGNNTWGGAVAKNGHTVIQADSGSTLTFSNGTFYHGSQQPHAVTFVGAGNITVNGTMNNWNAPVTKGLAAADTGTLTLAGVSTYGVVTTINYGTLKLGVSSSSSTSGPLGHSTGTGTIVASGATLDMNGYSLTGGATEALSLSGTGVGGNGALINSSATPSTYIGVITFSAAASVVGGAGTIAITGTPASGTTAISLGGAAGGSISTVIDGARTLTKEGAGTWTLSGANTYSGLTTVSAGTLRLGHASDTMDGAITVSGGILDVDNPDTVGTVTLVSGTISGDSALTSTATLEMKSGSASTILAGSVALSKTTSGTVTLSGANSYSGATTVSEGRLLLNNATSTCGGSAITVASGAYLGGSGFSGTGLVTVNAGGGLAPGTTAVGTQTVGTSSTNANLTANGMIYEWEWNGGAGSNDLVHVKGDLAFNAGTYTVKLVDLGGASPQPEQRYNLFTYAGAAPTQRTWTIDLGTTGWNALTATVGYDTGAKTVYLTGLGLPTQEGPVMRFW